MPSSAGFSASTMMFSDPAILSFGGMTGEIGSFDGRFDGITDDQKVGSPLYFPLVDGGMLVGCEDG